MSGGGGRRNNQHRLEKKQINRVPSCNRIERPEHFLKFFLVGRHIFMRILKDTVSRSGRG